MQRVRAIAACPSSCRQYSTSPHIQPILTLTDASITTFRHEAFQPALPALLPRKHFAELPAIRKWFSHIPGSTMAVSDPAAALTLNTTYLSRFGGTSVPVEISNDDRFVRIPSSLSFFLECVRASTSTYAVQEPPRRYFSAHLPGARPVRRTARSNAFFSASATLTAPTAQVYLAQAPLPDLPRALRDDVPTPNLVSRAGKGDVYDSSIWLGLAPTYTPLHRDPNPNLFVQLAGRKIVRLLRPGLGAAVFAAVQEKIGGDASATMRGEEMMQGKEKVVLEEEVWGESAGKAGDIWEATLDAGDGLFIPKGWWHSVKGVGSGITGSVNWWFR